jgi:hypothetical protein
VTRLRDDLSRFAAPHFAARVPTAICASRLARRPDPAGRGCRTWQELPRAIVQLLLARSVCLAGAM